MTVFEFGVASGRGLLSMYRIAAALKRATGVQFDVVGLDTGRGMPPARDYRDHPEYYWEGDFAVLDAKLLAAMLPTFAQLIIGDVAEAVREFVPTSPIGFVAVDVDYFSSAMDCMSVLESPADRLLPCTPVFFDDVLEDNHNPWCGELPAGYFYLQ